MATNLAIDDTLIEEAKAIGHHRTKKGAVTEALREYIQRIKISPTINPFCQSASTSREYKASQNHHANL